MTGAELVLRWLAESRADREVRAVSFGFVVTERRGDGRHDAVILFDELQHPKIVQCVLARASADLDAKAD